MTDTHNFYIPLPAPWRTVSQPRGVFRGKNMLTPTVLAYARARIDRVTLYVEVSHGSAMHWIGHDIYGLTFRRANGATPDPDPSKPVHSIEEVAETLEQVCIHCGEELVL